MIDSAPSRPRDEVTIDFSDFADAEARVLAGRPRGKSCRDSRDLDYLDTRENVTVSLLVPARIRSVTSSFFLGMLAPSIRRLGEDGFRRRYILVGEHVREAFEYCVLVASTTGSALSDP